MTKKLSYRFLAASVVLVALLTACGPAAPAPVFTVEPPKPEVVEKVVKETVVVEKTVEVVVTATPTAEPTPTPTSAEIPAATAVAMVNEALSAAADATATAEAKATPTPTEEGGLPPLSDQPPTPAPTTTPIGDVIYIAGWNEYGEYEFQTVDGITVIVSASIGQIQFEDIYKYVLFYWVGVDEEYHTDGAGFVLDDHGKTVAKKGESEWLGAKRATVFGVNNPNDYAFGWLYGRTRSESLTKTPPTPAPTRAPMSIRILTKGFNTFGEYEYWLSGGTDRITPVGVVIARELGEIRMEDFSSYVLFYWIEENGQWVQYHTTGAGFGLDDQGNLVAKIGGSPWLGAERSKLFGVNPLNDYDFDWLRSR